MGGKGSQGAAPPNVFTFTPGPEYNPPAKRARTLPPPGGERSDTPSQSGRSSQSGFSPQARTALKGAAQGAAKGAVLGPAGTLGGALMGYLDAKSRTPQGGSGEITYPSRSDMKGRPAGSELYHFSKFNPGDLVVKNDYSGWYQGPYRAGAGPSLLAGDDDESDNYGYGSEGETLGTSYK